MYDINTVCRMLGVTSRTLRFYEEKKIITSTKKEFSKVRHYTEEQLEQIKKVVVLRSLGISVKSIEKLFNEKSDLKNVIIEKRAELIASIVSRKKEIELMNEVLMQIDAGEEIFSKKENSIIQNSLSETLELFTDMFILDNVQGCFDMFSDVMKGYLPLEAFKRVKKDTLLPLGSFIGKKETVISPTEKDSIYSYLEYEKLILIVKCVIRQNKIYGLWFTYAEKRN